MVGDVRGMGKVRYVHNVSVGKPERNAPLDSARRRLKDKYSLT